MYFPSGDQRGETLLGARKRGDAASGEVEDANRAFRVASSERAGRVDDPFPSGDQSGSVCGPSSRGNSRRTAPP